MDLYADNILDHYRNPRHKGALAKPDAEHMELNASCGDSLSVQLRIRGNTVEDVRWQGTGCAISQAGMSLLSEELPGKPLWEVAALSPSKIYELLGVPVGPRRTKCALLPLLALHNALRAWKKEPPLTWAELLEEVTARPS